MTQNRLSPAVAVALALGVAVGGVAPSQAQIGTGNSIIGAGDETIGAVVSPDDPKANRAEARAFGDCIVNRIAYRTQENLVQTSSGAFATMPNTHVPVTHADGCLVVDLAVEMTNSDGSGNLMVRAVINGIGVATPIGTLLGRVVSPTVYETRSMRFMFPNVPAGTHTVKIEWLASGGGTASAQKRTLTVQHR